MSALTKWYNTDPKKTREEAAKKRIKEDTKRFTKNELIKKGVQFETQEV